MIKSRGTFLLPMILTLFILMLSVISIHGLGAASAVAYSSEAYGYSFNVDTVEEAEELARKAQERADKALENTKGGLLDDKDDFFSKADRFARGDYHNKGGKDMQIEQDPDYQRKKNEGKAAGFEDHDGDGDEIIDDAVLDDDGDEPTKE